MSNIVEVKITEIIVDPEINVRKLDEELVREYVQSMQLLDRPHWQDHWGSLPKVTRSRHLWGGFHTYAAAFRQWGNTCVLRCHERGENERDAFFLATSENHMHGRRRSSEEKRVAVLRWLEDEEMREWSDNHIAQQCHVSVMFVSRMSEELVKFGNYERPTKRKSLRDGTLYWINTSPIGKTPVEDLDDAPVLTEAMKDEEVPEESVVAIKKAEYDQAMSDLECKWKPHLPLPAEKRTHPAVTDARKNYQRIKTTGEKLNSAKALQEWIEEIGRAHAIFEDADRYQNVYDNIIALLADYHKRWKQGEYEFPFLAFCEACADTFQLPENIFTDSYVERFKLDMEELEETRNLLAQGLSDYDLRGEALELPQERMDAIEETDREHATEEEAEEESDDTPDHIDPETGHSKADIRTWSTEDLEAALKTQDELPEDEQLHGHIEALETEILRRAEETKARVMGYNIKLQDYITKSFKRIEKRCERFQPYDKEIGKFTKQDMLGEVDRLQERQTALMKADKWHISDELEPLLESCRYYERKIYAMTPTFEADPPAEEEPEAVEPRIPTPEDRSVFSAALSTLDQLQGKFNLACNQNDFKRVDSLYKDMALQVYRLDTAFTGISNALKGGKADD